MTANYVLLEKITVGAAGASSVTFSGIPQTGYTDLVVKVSARSSSSTSTRAAAYLTFNGSATSYSDIRVYGQDANATGSSASDGGGTSIGGTRFPNATNTANTFGNMEYYIPNYTAAVNKSVSADSVSENNSANPWNVSLVAGLWSNTAAITSITITDGLGSFAANSTFYLYGVAKLGTTPAIVPYATGGDTIMTDGTYWYHAFKSSGTFTPAKGLSCDVLVVAGGGGGGGTNGSGGGAGGIFYATSQSLSTTGLTVTVGAGGGGGANGNNGSSGSDSQFGSLTLAKGGGQGSLDTSFNGGSGGGAYANGVTPGVTNSGGTSTQTSTGGTGYGNAGGSAIGLTQPPYGGGGGAGGGGAGSAGSPTSSGGGGAGGAGLNTWSSWASVTGTGVSGYFAGGGGGSCDNRVSTTVGAGGSGGGGAGSYTSNGVAGTANTGGGGGGAGYNGSSWAGGNGGSGLVIVRYAV